MQFGDAGRYLLRIYTIADRHLDECLHKLADFRPQNELRQFGFSIGDHHGRKIVAPFGRTDDRGDKIRQFVCPRDPTIMHLLSPKIDLRNAGAVAASVSTIVESASSVGINN